MKHLLLTTIAAVVLVGCGPPPKDIWEAAEQGNIEVVKQHLADGTDVNAKTEDNGRTPLHCATVEGQKETVELLIANGADVKDKEKELGMTPLHYAAGLGLKEVAELLIAKGADVNVKLVHGLTPLEIAIANNKTETAELLRKHDGKTVKELKAEGK